MSRVAYICADPGVPVFGRKGASIHVQEVIRALRGRRAEVVLFAARVGGDPPADLHDLSVVTLPEIRERDIAAREQAALGLNPVLERLLSAHQPFDFFYERHSLWSYAGMEFADAHGLPALLEVNAPLLLEQANYRSLHDAGAAEASVRRSFAAADAIFAVSQGMAQYVESFREAAGKTQIVPNGVDPSRFSPHPRTKTPFTVGFVGTLKPWHGVETLVEAFAILHARRPETRLLIVGDGPQREPLERLASQAGIASAVEFTGAVSAAEIPALLARMHVAAAPYPQLDDFYFSPLKVFEYMAAGCAIVASAIGQIVNVLEDGRTALFHPAGDAAALAQAVERLYDDPPLRTRLGEAARQRALARHTWDAIARHILETARALSRGAAAHASARAGVAG